MSNATLGASPCPLPFVDMADYPYRGGFESGRLCAPFPTGQTECCLPCPLTDWVYPDNFSHLTGVANWLNVGSITCCVVLLLTLWVLPVQKTSRHYLTICLLFAVGFMSLAFIVPLGTKPSQCYDAITPNDIHSNLSCAFSGSFVTFGGFGAVMWVFLRSLSLHLQICWQVIPGRKFFLGAIVAGWGVPAVSLALVLTLTGMSYRFGTTCHTNHNNSVATFWGPILAFAGACAILQITTLAYCIRVYIRSILNPDDTSQNSSNLPSHQGSVKTVTARAAYRRVRKVIALQWRGIVIVSIIVANVVFFAIIFIKMDNATTRAQQNLDTEFAWVLCLFESGGNKNECLPLTVPFVMNEATVMAVLYMLSLNGYWSVLFLGRWSMVTGWFEIIKAPFNRSHDFVSVDARRISDPRNYEMLTSPPQPVYLHKNIDDIESSPNMGQHSPRDWEPSAQKEGYFGKEATYRSPSLSFSSPRPPSRPASEAPRQTSSHGKSAGSVAWEDEKLGSTILERSESPSSLYGSDSPPGRPQPAPARGWERSGSALRTERSLSALGRERSGSALGRNSPQMPSTSPTPGRPNPNSALGREWDPRSTYARGGAPNTQRGDNGLEYHTYVRRGERPPR